MQVRIARKEDLPLIVEMIADDPLGSQREDFRDPLPQSYWRAFECIDADSNNELYVVELEGKIVGTFQLTYIPSISFKGGLRTQIEAVRIHRDFRSRGLGKRVFEWAIERAKEKDCNLVQLTTNKTRDRAQDFYLSLGFESTHEGMKLYLKKW